MPGRIRSSGIFPKANEGMIPMSAVPSASSVRASLVNTSIAKLSNELYWLALTLTPGLGPTRSKRLVDFFGSVEGIFNASLTELEAAGLPVQAAQAIGTGRAMELAHDEA